MAAQNGTSGRVTFGDHASHLITGDMTFAGWFWLSTANNAGATFAEISCGGTDAEIDNILFNLQLGTENADTVRWKLKYIHESGAGTDTTFETTGEIYGNSWFPVVVVRDTAAKTIRIVTPWFDETSSAYTTNPTTTDTAATFVVGNGISGTPVLTSSQYEKIGLFNRKWNDSEIGSFLVGYAPNQANYGSSGQVYYASLNTAATKDEGSGGGTVATGGTVTFPFVAIPAVTTGAPISNNKRLMRLDKAPTSNVIATGAAATYMPSGSTTLNASGLPSPTNCYAKDATASSQACAQNNGYVNLYTGFDFSAIPNGSTVIGANIMILRKCSTTASGWWTFSGMWSSRSDGAASGAINGLNGSAVSDATEPTTYVESGNIIHWPTRTQLQGANFNVHVGHGRSSSLTAVTGDIDGVSVVAWYLVNASPAAKASTRGPIARRRRLAWYNRRR